MFSMILFKNEIANLAHVMISEQDDSRTSIAVQYSKARWLHRKNDELSESSSHLLSDGFLWMLQNSNENDWSREVVGVEETVSGANHYKVQLTLTLRENGYITTEARGSAHGEFTGTSSPSWASKSAVFTAANTTLGQLKKFAAKCSLGMDLSEDLFNKVVRDCYASLIDKNGTGEISKFSIWRIFKAA